MVVVVVVERSTSVVVDPGRVVAVVEVDVEEVVAAQAPSPGEVLGLGGDCSAPEVGSGEDGSGEDCSGEGFGAGQVVVVVGAGGGAGESEEPFGGVVGDSGGRGTSKPTTSAVEANIRCTGAGRAPAAPRPLTSPRLPTAAPIRSFTRLVRAREDESVVASSDERSPTIPVRTSSASSGLMGGTGSAWWAA